MEYTPDKPYVIIACGSVYGRYETESEAEQSAMELANELNQNLRIYFKDYICEIRPGEKPVWWCR